VANAPPRIYCTVKLPYSFSFFIDMKADIKKQIPANNISAEVKDNDNLKSKLIKE